MKDKVLVIICNNYPFGLSETFLINEIPFLSEGFDKIYVISKNIKDEKVTQTPDNVFVTRYNPTSSLSDKLKIPGRIIKNFSLITQSIRDEIRNIKDLYNTPFLLRYLRIMFHDIIKAIELRDFILNTQKTVTDNPGILFYSYWMDSSSLALVLLKRSRPGIKIISRAHRIDLYFYANKSKYLSYRNLISKNLDRIFFISDDGKKYMEELLKYKNPEFCVSKLGTSRKVKYQEERIRYNKNLVVSCSNVIPVKRVDLIIKALAKLEKFPVHWIHLGGGPLLQEMKRLAAENIHNLNVSYEFKGALPNPDILHFYAENLIDIFINVSSSEGIPVSIMEAMSYKIPVIATNVGGTGEIVNHQNGVLLNPFPDENEVVAALNKLLDQSDEEKENMKIQAYKTWETQFNADRNYTNFVQDLLKI